LAVSDLVRLPRPRLHAPGELANIWVSTLLGTVFCSVFPTFSVILPVGVPRCRVLVSLCTPPATSSDAKHAVTRAHGDHPRRPS
jgi:hypothetical protein